jgi:hypothetical protein
VKTFIATLIITIGLIALLVTPLSATERPNIRAMIERSNEANDYCRGGSGDDRETLAWCDVREALDEVLNVRNWCYGKQGEFGYQNKWHACTKNSLRPKLKF